MYDECYRLRPINIYLHNWFGGDESDSFFAWWNEIINKEPCEIGNKHKCHSKMYWVNSKRITSSWNVQYRTAKWVYNRTSWANYRCTHTYFTKYFAQHASDVVIQNKPYVDAVCVCFIFARRRKSSKDSREVVWRVGFLHTKSTPYSPYRVPLGTTLRYYFGSRLCLCNLHYFSVL